MLLRFQGDLLMGNLNIDPSRRRRRDQEPLRPLRPPGETGWRRAHAEGSLSYWSYSGVTRTMSSCAASVLAS